MKLVYPACFYQWEDKVGYTVTVPDLPGCVTEGSSLVEAILMGVDAASGWVLDELEEGRPVPSASKIENVQPEPGGFVSMLILDMNDYADKYGNKAVQKKLTIPAYMSTYAEKQNIDFSQLVQEVLSERMQTGE